MSHIPPGVTKKKRGVMDVMDFAIDEMDDAKRKKVIHYAMRKLQDAENELQDAVKCGEVAKVAKGRAVKRAQDAEDRVQVLDGVLEVVYEDKDALKQQLEVAEKRAQDAEEREEALQQQLKVAAENRASVLDGVCVLIEDKDALKQQLEVAEKRAQDAEEREEALQQQLKVTAERAQDAEKRAQVYEEISNARSAQALTSFIKRRQEEESEKWKDIVYGKGFYEIPLTVEPITIWPKVSSRGRYQPPDSSEIKDLRRCGEVYVQIFGREYSFPTLVARAFLGQVPHGSLGVAYRHGDDNASDNLEYMAAPASLQEPVYVPTPDEEVDGSYTPSWGAAPSSPPPQYSPVEPCYTPTTPSELAYAYGYPGGPTSPSYSPDSPSYDMAEE